MGRNVSLGQNVFVAEGATIATAAGQNNVSVYRGDAQERRSADPAWSSPTWQPSGSAADAGGAVCHDARAPRRHHRRSNDGVRDRRRRGGVHHDRAVVTRCPGQRPDGRCAGSPPRLGVRVRAGPEVSATRRRCADADVRIGRRTPERCRADGARRPASHTSRASTTRTTRDSNRNAGRSPTRGSGLASPGPTRGRSDGRRRRNRADRRHASLRRPCEAADPGNPRRSGAGCACVRTSITSTFRVVPRGDAFRAAGQRAS